MGIVHPVARSICERFAAVPMGATLRLAGDEPDFLTLA